MANEEDNFSKDLDFSADSLIDNVKSCAATYRCHLPVSAPARFCNIHLQAATLVLSTYGKAIYFITPFTKSMYQPKPLAEAIENSQPIQQELTSRNSL
jgi:hypothetical protein